MRSHNTLPAVIKEPDDVPALDPDAPVGNEQPFVRVVFTTNFSHQSRADLAGPNVLPASLVADVYNYSTPGFKVPLPGSGGLGRNVFTGPGYWNVDLGIAKNFDLTENVRMQVRAEASTH